jgi:pimeloyl-ACP methyl ester carboxylesterase
MQTVSHNNRSTAYEVFDRGGDGIPVLLVHGSGGARGVWKSQARLADDRPIVAMDLSGHGDSDDVDASPGYETLSAYTDDVVAVADATDAGILCGNSLGGAVVLHTLLNRSHRRDFDGAVYAGTGAKLAVLEDLRNWLAEDFERAVSWLHEPGRLFDDADDQVVDLSRTTMLDCGRETVERDFLTSHTFDVRDRLDEITVPGRAIVGENDALTPPHYHDYLAAEIGDCDVAIVEDAAHLAMLERPRAFNAALHEFCERVEN